MRQIAFSITLLFFIKVSHGQTIETQKIIDQDSLRIDFINPFLCAVEFYIAPIDSVKQNFKFNKHFIIQAKDTCFSALKLPLSIVKDTSKVNITKFIKLKGTLGDPNKIKPNYRYQYTLPYQKGKSYKIVQTFGGKFSHNIKNSKYAIDFGLQIGDTITAARNGIVLFVKEDSKKHGKTRKYIDFANRIKILHNDGTIADYVHLDYNGVLVKVGDYITTGQPIGISGLTGFTKGPHLHFVVFKERSISIPIIFKDYKNKTLKKHEYYKRRK
ncbi:M23 family metallopeptidase [Jejuia spongiicola]|uniref:M23 family metallopeptidase n=1 Tax=Jejuia spongiicola TaxID=2942207 RepID=UPI0024C3950C|nr:M23 family metallopeptidase [Jejuia spongiicola]